MSSLAGIWEAVWGLLVEDGSLAIGIVAALAVTWIAAIALTGAQRDQVGWLLLAMLLVLVVLNLRSAGRRAREAMRSG
ncbi:MAG TPA: hypothetical protein VL333_02495 [Candidatus Saccharimonadales bacterium]|nr:hypothetical protein [Candidatus Saccharimonadales bacterium]